jgi:two-component system sensor histidine kinase QseC
MISSSVLIAARMLSRDILSPFNESLAQMQKFNLRKKKPLLLASESNTKEFKELNLLLKKMTDMAITEYGLVKEFSENASHELQTPLSVLRSKLELLAETDIQGNQAY